MPLSFPLVAVSTNPFFKRKSGSIILYKDWDCAQLDLSAYINQTVTVEFIAGDCSQGAHWGYVYLDDICLSCDSSSSGNCNITSVSSPCDNLPIQVCGTFALPVPPAPYTSASLQSISLQLCHNGVAVGAPITSFTIISNNQFCFLLNMQNFLPPVTNPSDGYDFVATATFLLSGSGVPSTTVSKASSTPGNGFISGQNNDYFINCCSSCCDTFYITINSSLIKTGSDWYVKSFLTTSPTRIIEIKAELVNFYMNHQKGCERCVSDNLFLGSMVPTGNPPPTSTSQINWNPSSGSSWITPAQPYSGSPRELVWNKKIGGTYISRPPLHNDLVWVQIKIPPAFKNACCNDTSSFCIRWLFKDSTCRVCDTLICYNTNTFIPEWQILTKQNLLNGTNDPVNVELNRGRVQLNDSKLGPVIEKWYKDLIEKQGVTYMVENHLTEVKPLIKIARKLIQENGKLEQGDVTAISNSMKILNEKVSPAPVGLIEEIVNRLKSSVGLQYKEVLENLKK